MVHIQPFKAVRPPAHLAHLVASRSYVSYGATALQRKLNENPFSFIHIINPEHGAPKRTKPNSVERFRKVRGRYEQFCREGILKADELASFYIYRQDTPEASFTGLICGVSIDDYAGGRVKIHEHTLTAREQTFCTYLDTCNFNAEPVLLTYRENIAELQALLAAQQARRPDCDFSTTDRHRHQLWSITDTEIQGKISAAFAHVPHLYIADGHHRMASSALLGQRRREAGGHPDAMHNCVLSLIIPSEQLLIKPFHRLLNLGLDFDQEAFLEKLKQEFVVTPCGTCCLPDEARLWGMRLRNGWYTLRLRQPLHAHNEVERLDAAILSEKILKPCLGIVDEKTDPRIQFIPGNLDLDPFIQTIDKGGASVLFTLFPVNADALFAVADVGGIMPPKSTWVAPKLRSGLTIMELD